MPWQRKRFKKTLPYLAKRANELLIMPTAHMMLHGLEANLFCYALQSGPCEGHWVIFDARGLQLVQVLPLPTPTDS